MIFLIEKKSGTNRSCNRSSGWFWNNCFCVQICSIIFFEYKQGPFVKFFSFHNRFFSKTSGNSTL